MLRMKSKTSGLHPFVPSACASVEIYLRPSLCSRSLTHVAFDDVDGTDPIATISKMFALRNASLVARKLPARR